MPIEQRPLVTIIIALLNNAGTLQRCLDSLTAQSYPRKELIIMDGGSTDGSVEILKANNRQIAYAESKPDRGIFHAWNKALDHAHGEGVCFLGADDYYATPQSLDLIATTAARGEFDLICARGMYVENAGAARRVWGEPWNWERLKKEQRICHPGSLYRRRLFEQFGNFSEEYPIVGDYEFTLRLGKDVKAFFVDEVIVCLGGGGVSRSKWAQALIERTRVQRRHNEIGLLRALCNSFWTATKIIAQQVLAFFGYSRKS